KAFDSVSHAHILAVLKQRGVDQHIIGLIRDLHENINTCIKTEEGKTQPIGIKNGVKQGDPMSPLLFNLCIDPLIEELQLSGEGYRHEGAEVTTMAFADDLVLLSGSWEGMEKNIAIVEAFCELTGLKTQGEK
ncbi:PO21 protein, partial [Psilopogon haemacephalus]|nr:PO21 protein [Psilopogon haemacephalus]